MTDTVVDTALAAVIDKLDKPLAEKIKKLFAPPQKKKGIETSDDAREKFDYLKVAQPTTEIPTGPQFDKMKSGDFFTQSTHIGKTFTAYPVFVWHTRAKWEQGDSKRVLDCSSPDAKTPLDDKYATSCDSCKFARGSKEKPSPCVRVLNVVLVDKDFNGVYILQFQKTSLKTGNKVLEIMSSGSASEPVFHSEIQFSASKSKDGRPYYVLDAKQGEKCPAGYLPILDKLQEKFSRTVKEKIAALLEGRPEEDEDVLEQVEAKPTTAAKPAGAPSAPKKLD